MLGVAPMSDSPADRYYAALVGRYRGSFRFEIRDPERMQRELAGPGDRARVRAEATASRLLGPSTMRTTLAFDPIRRVALHTTRVSRVGVTIAWTRETLELLDERRLRMFGHQRYAPLAWQKLPYEASGEIDDTGTQATYRTRWLGCELVQRTRIVPEGLYLSQETGWSFGDVTLIRQPG